MILYATTSKEDFDHLKSYISGKYGVGTNVNYILSGWWDGTKWMVANPNTVPLYSGAIPADSNQMNCMKITGNGSQLYTEKITCGATPLPGICESI